MNQQADIKTLVIRAGAVGRYENKQAVGVFCGILLEEPDRRFWGYGLITNTESLFARCIADVLNDLFPGTNAPSLKVVVERDGFRKYLETHVPKWMANNGLNSQGRVPDQYEAWRYVYDLVVLAGTVTIQADIDGTYKPLLKQASRDQKFIASRALSKLKEAPTNNFESDNGLLSDFI